MHHTTPHHYHRTNWMPLITLIIFTAGCVVMVRLIMVTVLQHTASEPFSVAQGLVMTSSATPDPTATPRLQPTHVTRTARASSNRPASIHRTGTMIFTEMAVTANTTAAAVLPVSGLITATSLPSFTPVEPALTPTPAEPGSSRSDPLPPGTELRFNHWAVVITDVLYGEEAVRIIDETNPLNLLPRIGHTYLLATVQLTNISAEPDARNTLTAIDLRATGNRHHLYRQAPVVPPHPPGSEIIPGEMTEVQFVFEIGLDEAHLLLRVQEESTPARFVAVAADTVLTPSPELGRITSNKAGIQREMPAAWDEAIITDEWEIGLVEVVRGTAAAELVQAVNPLNPQAPPGVEYIAVKLRARFIDYREPDMIRHIDRAFLEIIDTQNVTYQHPLVIPPAPILEADLFPGGAVEGWVVLSAPSDAKQIALLFRSLESSSADTMRFLALE